MRAAVASVLVVAFGAVLLATAGAGASDSSAPLKPLSSLGQLRPTPYPGPVGPELIPIPVAPLLAAPSSTARVGKTVDGIECQRNAKLAFHEHAHLAVLVNGKWRKVPAGIGIWPPLTEENFRHNGFGIVHGNCQSWLSTHFPDGIIHVEAPIKRSFVLGELFDVWGQPLSRTRVGPARGAVTAFVNGMVWTGNPRLIPVGRHSRIQLQVGKPLVKPIRIDFPGSY